ncbi:class I SAM-dependent RNA methyltransferase [Herbiconiux ginsengi]|uniref:tRNA (Uracil-5-)-methyltransferase n=1 Tax=Herbiconiux ginsengi TaxID=381665 RepID=A0A1H3SS71_9MICO|nr:class I SAM-dependent RNA methyltransferase [Herbiconiux ginsengi]SDZ40866.1 tRNA (Uracil-5-)-methyltransferase [Herbiconiux ginsengi]
MEDQNELVELDIDNVAHGGVMVARLDGRVVFVADAIPGERVLARIADDSKSSFWRADTVEVLTASPDRRPHVWAAAALERAPELRAGGAEFGHIALERQRSLKSEVLTDALRRFGGITRAVEVEPIGADAAHDSGRVDSGAAGGTRWRTRVRLHVGPGGRVGPYAARSHTVIAVDDLPLATEAIEAEAREVAKTLRGDAQGAAAVEFVETADGELRVSLVPAERSKTGGRGRDGARGAGRNSGRGAAGRDRRGGGGGSSAASGGQARPGDGRGRSGWADDGLADDVPSATRARNDRADSRATGGATAPRASGAPRADAPATIVERVGEREFRLAENGFWQVHRDAARTLSRAVGELTREDLFDPRAANHDLYGGVGLLAAAIGDRFGPATRITSVESDATATDHASENLAEWIGARAVTGRVDRYLAELEKVASSDDRRRLQAATMVIDPPRSGAGKEVVASLIRLDVAQVVYVACDPVAFARDVALFREGGYELDAVRAYDLFPHTHHLETIGVLVKP